MEGQEVIVAGREPRVAAVLAQIVTETTGATVYIPELGDDLVKTVSHMPAARMLLLEIERYMTDRLEAVRRIRALRPEMVIVALSFGHAAALAAELGCQDALEEPFEVEEVQTILRKYL